MSDLDLVVVFQKLENAYRESSRFDNWPVEAFVHDSETLNYFFQMDRVSGVPSLPNMVNEGVEVRLCIGHCWRTKIAAIKQQGEWKKVGETSKTRSLTLPYCLSRLSSQFWIPPLKGFAPVAIDYLRSDLQ